MRGLAKVLLAPAVALLQLAAAQKTPANDAFFSDLARYAAFSSAAYSSNCSVPPYGSAAVRYFDVANTSIQATVFRDDARRELVLSFRGTSDTIDWGINAQVDLVPCEGPGFRCGNCTCHKGYLSQYNSLATQLKADLDARTAALPGYRLVVTGHSMGGALASLAGTSLKAQGLSPAVYTYGQPRAGNQAFADHVDRLFPPPHPRGPCTASNSTAASTDGEGMTMFRVTHDNDGVPQLYNRTLGYQHHSAEVWQADDPPSANATFLCSGGQEPQDCNQSRPGYGVGVGGIGINAAHLVYFGISVGNPADTEAACRGIV